MDLQSMRLFHISLLILYSCKGICEISTNWLFEENNACGTEGICECYNRDFVEHIVDCDNISIDVIPRDLPINTTRIFLSHNKLKVVPHKAFHDLIKLDNLNLGTNVIEQLFSDSFENLVKLTTLILDSNKLQTLPNNVFNGLSSLQDLSLSYNMINAIHNGTFHGLNCLEKLYLSYNKLTNIPSNTFGGLNHLGKLLLGMNEIEILHSDSFSGLIQLDMLDLNGNNLPILPETVFGDLRFLTTLYLDDDSIIDLQNSYFIGLQSLKELDLSHNKISHIHPSVFNCTDAFWLETLLLPDNQLTAIQRDTFIALQYLQFLCLYNNKIHDIEDNAFNLMNLRYLYLFQNRIGEITGNSFNSNVLEELHLYGNEIHKIEAESLFEIPNNTTIYLSCDSLSSVPINLEHDHMICVNPSYLPYVSMHGFPGVAERLSREGFECLGEHGECICRPCGAGTYGGKGSEGCCACPAGGFYQDEIAQTEPSNVSMGIPCKLCNEGTYVKEGGGSSPKDCDVCPEGTNKSIHAGLRACYCKENYARMDRYGPCFLCLEEGLNCSQEFQALQPGYMWNWSIPDANLKDYMSFLDNLMVDNDTTSMHTTYTGEVPRIFRCPRTESCPNNNNSITGNCATGYTGWLCTNCEPDYYSVLTACVPCPSLSILIVESCLFLFACALICLLLTRHIRRRSELERYSRSFIDIMIARIKILLGFYQVIGEIFTSLHDINWTGPLVVMGTFISTFEMNILRLFVRPRCFDIRFDLNPKIQFIIGAISPVIVVLIPFMLYQTKKVYVRLRFSQIVRMSFRSQFETLKRCFTACVVVLWFIIYPPVCSVIFSLYPLSCQSFPLDQAKTYMITRLRSDLDVDCTGLRAYHISALVLTVIYVIAFPVALLFFLYQNIYDPSRQESSILDDLASVNSDSINTSKTQLSSSTWLNFLSENYKREFWYWEIVELARKVTQTFLITLFGWEHRLTVILTTCISVLFLLLHARFRPMKSSYEQRLQMFSLTVIFINVIIAANDFPDEHEGSITILLVLLNIIVLVIIAGELLVTIIMHIKHTGTVTFFLGLFRGLRQTKNTE